MIDERREHLRSWYRRALGERASRLESLVPGVAEGRDDAVAEARTVARALVGSGATFGFPDVTEAGLVVAASGVDDEVGEVGPEEEAPGSGGDGLLPRVVGLIDLLHRVSAGAAPAGDRAGRWLVFAAGPLPDPPEGGAVPPDLGLAEAWTRVAARLEADPEEVARRVAGRLGVAVADPSSAEPAARLVVPPALALAHRLLPLRDEESALAAASANPTDVVAMAALERATGRTARLEVLAPARLAAALRETYGTAGTDGPPDHGAPPRALHRGAAPGEPSAGPTVLVVDDDPGDRLLCRTALERAGMEVLEAGDGPAALEILDGGESVDAALVDVLMPEMDGGGLLAAIRAHPVRARLPVVILTGLRSAAREARLMEEGADDYLRKPVEPRVLVARIRACLRRSGAARTP